MTRSGRDLAPSAYLFGVRSDGRPLYVGSDSPLAAAAVRVDALWPGGSSGLNLTGELLPGDLAIWDSGLARTTHRELIGRVTAGHATVVDEHATKVAGTLIAAGIDPDLRGMAPAGRLTSHYWNNDANEMADSADELRLSNHSYSRLCGWGWDSEGYYWYGDLLYSDTEDIDFGRYTSTTELWDRIAAAAPRYLICKSAGNYRGINPPPTGTPHRVFDPEQGQWIESFDHRPSNGYPLGYDTLPPRANAKNLLTVAAVKRMLDGYTGPESAALVWSSGCGPTDDGRLKPDLVAIGQGLIVCSADSDEADTIFGGTSSASAMVCGVQALLLQQYRQLNPGEPDLLASTRKAIVLHTAREAGSHPGPDFGHGWGLLDALGAATLIDESATMPGRIVEGELTAGRVDSLDFWNAGLGDLRVTLCWTDPAGEPVEPMAMDAADPMLVNDLDLRIVRRIDGAVFEPWVLDPHAPGVAATTGDNHRDNVEQVEILDAARGNWLVLVSHKGDLAASQSYSLVQTGLIGQAAPRPHAPPASVKLEVGGPNPGTDTITLRLIAERPVPVTVTLHDIRGRRLRTLTTEPMEPGLREHVWDGCDETGHKAAAGVYLVRLECPEGVVTQRVTIVR